MSDQVQNEKFEVHNENLAVGHETGITAVAPSAQLTAYQIAQKNNIVQVVDAAGAGVKLRPALIGEEIVVFNASANALDVYPFEGEYISALGPNVADTLAAGASKRYYGIATAQWAVLTMS